MTTTELTPGAVIDGFRIEAEAGQGGSSVVYRATDLDGGRPVAIKTLTTTDPSARRRLVREAQLLAGVRHPGVVPFRALRQLDDVDLLITDWVHGESLRDRLRRTGPLTPEQGRSLLSALADGLDHLHRQGIVHRDISPSNVIIDDNGTPVIIDLGIGHHVDSRTMTRDDLLAGTPKYLAPEIIRGEPADGRADQYSVGIMLHELLTGTAPFPSADRLATSLHHQLHSAPIPLDEVDPAMPTAMAEAVLMSLAKEPEDRFPSMADFAAAANGANPARGAAEPDRPSGVLLSIGLLAAAVVVAVAGAVWLVTTQTEPPQSATPDPEAIAEAAPDDSAGGTDEEPPAGDGDGDDTSVIDAVATAAPIDPLQWPEGEAARLTCNLLTGTDFTSAEVPVDYFGEPANLERVVPDRGFGGSAALEVGLVDNFGQYGEIVPIVPGQSYLFTGWFTRSGPIAEAEFGIVFLTPDYDPFPAGIEGELAEGSEAFLEIGPITAPPGTGFAVPYVFKDSSPGVLLADELIFGQTEACRREIADRS